MRSFFSEQTICFSVKEQPLWQKCVHMDFLTFCITFAFLCFFSIANMIESKSFEVELKDAEPDIIEQLVEFAYTARYCICFTALFAYVSSVSCVFANTDDDI